MSYTFQPLTDEELDAVELIEPGMYDFEVFKSEHKYSQAGNPMAKLQLKVWNDKVKVGLIFDLLIFSTAKLNIRKVSHFCKAVGLYEEYKKGELPLDLAMLGGKVQIGIEEEQPNPRGGMYPKKNIVLDYISSDKPQVKREEEALLTEDVPF